MEDNSQLGGTAMSFCLPIQLKNEIKGEYDKQNGRFSTVSEFVRHLVRQALDAEQERRQKIAKHEPKPANRAPYGFGRQ